MKDKYYKYFNPNPEGNEVRDLKEVILEDFEYAQKKFSYTNNDDLIDGLCDPYGTCLFSMYNEVGYGELC